MKKRIIIIVSIVLVLIIGIIVFLIIKHKKDRDYELLKVSEYKYINLSAEGKQGVIRIDGEVILDPKYDEVQIPNPDIPIFITKKDGEIRVYNSSKEEIFTEFEEVEGITVAKQDGTDEINNTVLKYKESGKYGLVDFDGKKITKAKYDEITSLKDKYGEIRVKKNDKYGVINIKGTTMVKCKYDEVKGDDYTENGSHKPGGYIVGKKTDDGMRYGYLNKDGKTIVKIDQETLYRVTEIKGDEEYLIASQNGRYCIYKGKEKLVDYKYLDILYNKESGTFTGQKNKSYGLLSKNANEIVSPEYDYLLVTGEYVNVTKGDQNYIYDLNGSKVEEPQFVSLYKTKTDKYYIAANKEYKYGILDNDKKIVIEPTYDYMEQLENTDIIIATKGKNITLFSANIKEIINSDYIDYDIVNGYIKIMRENDTKYFTMDGVEVDNRTVFVNNEIFAEKQNGKWGFVNMNDETVVDFIYDEVTEVNEYGFAGIKQDSKWGVINSKGEVILEPTYESNIREPEFIGKYYKRDNRLTDVM